MNIKFKTAEEFEISENYSLEEFIFNVFDDICIRHPFYINHKDKLLKTFKARIQSFYLQKEEYTKEELITLCSDKILDLLRSFNPNMYMMMFKDI